MLALIPKGWGQRQHLFHFPLSKGLLPFFRQRLQSVATIKTAKQRSTSSSSSKSSAASNRNSNNFLQQRQQHCYCSRHGGGLSGVNYRSALLTLKPIRTWNENTKIMSECASCCWCFWCCCSCCLVSAIGSYFQRNYVIALAEVAAATSCSSSSHLRGSLPELLSSRYVCSSD